MGRVVATRPFIFPFLERDLQCSTPDELRSFSLLGCMCRDGWLDGWQAGSVTHSLSLPPSHTHSWAFEYFSHLKACSQIMALSKKIANSSLPLDPLKKVPSQEISQARRRGPLKHDSTRLKSREKKNPTYLSWHHPTHHSLSNVNCICRLWSNSIKLEIL